MNEKAEYEELVSLVENRILCNKEIFWERYRQIIYYIESLVEKQSLPGGLSVLSESFAYKTFPSIIETVILMDASNSELNSILSLLRLSFRLFVVIAQYNEEILGFLYQVLDPSHIVYKNNRINFQLCQYLYQESLFQDMVNMVPKYSSLLSLIDLVGILSRIISVFSISDGRIVSNQFFDDVGPHVHRLTLGTITLNNFVDIIESIIVSIKDRDELLSQALSIFFTIICGILTSENDQNHPICGKTLSRIVLGVNPRPIKKIDELYSILEIIQTTRFKTDFYKSLNGFVLFCATNNIIDLTFFQAYILFFFHSGSINRYDVKLIISPLTALFKGLDIYGAYIEIISSLENNNMKFFFMSSLAELLSDQYSHQGFDILSDLYSFSLKDTDHEAVWSELLELCRTKNNALNDNLKRIAIEAIKDRKISVQILEFIQLLMNNKVSFEEEIIIPYFKFCNENYPEIRSCTISLILEHFNYSHVDIRQILLIRDVFSSTTTIYNEFWSVIKCIVEKHYGIFDFDLIIEFEQIIIPNNYEFEITPEYEFIFFGFINMYANYMGFLLFPCFPKSIGHLGYLSSGIIEKLIPLISLKPKNCSNLIASVLNMTFFEDQNLLKSFFDKLDTVFSYEVLSLYIQKSYFYSIEINNQLKIAKSENTYKEIIIQINGNQYKMNIDPTRMICDIQFLLGQIYNIIPNLIGIAYNGKNISNSLEPISAFLNTPNILFVISGINEQKLYPLLPVFFVFRNYFGNLFNEINVSNQAGSIFNVIQSIDFDVFSTKFSQFEKSIVDRITKSTTIFSFCINTRMFLYCGRKFMMNKELISTIIKWILKDKSNLEYLSYSIDILSSINSFEIENQYLSSFVDKIFDILRSSTICKTQLNCIKVLCRIPKNAEFNMLVSDHIDTHQEIIANIIPSNIPDYVAFLEDYQECIIYLIRQIVSTKSYIRNPNYLVFSQSIISKINEEAILLELLDILGQILGDNQTDDVFLAYRLYSEIFVKHPYYIKNYIGLGKDLLSTVHSISNDEHRDVVLKLISIISSQDGTHLMRNVFDSILSKYIESNFVQSPNGRIYPGLTNFGSTCFVNSVLQQFFYSIPFLIDFYSCKSAEMAFLIFHDLLTEVCTSTTSIVDSSEFTRSVITLSQGIFHFGEQGDAHEFYSFVTERLPKNTTQSFKGIFEQNITTYNGKILSSKSEPYSSIGLSLRHNSLENALHSFFSPEPLCEENQYIDSRTNKKINALKSTKIIEFPKVLVFHLARFSYDTTEHKRMKINKYFQFPVSIDMGSYSVSANSGYRYELSGIVVHSGTPDFGHYISVVKISGKWFCFNDSTVNEIDINYALQESYGGSENGMNAYLLFYESVDTNNNNMSTYGFSDQFDFSNLNQSIHEHIKNAKESIMFRDFVHSRPFCELLFDLNEPITLFKYFLFVAPRLAYQDIPKVIVERIFEYSDSDMIQSYYTFVRDQPQDVIEAILETNNDEYIYYLIRFIEELLRSYSILDSITLLESIHRGCIDKLDAIIQQHHKFSSIIEIFWSFIENIGNNDNAPNHVFEILCNLMFSCVECDSFKNVQYVMDFSRVFDCLTALLRPELAYMFIKHHKLFNKLVLFHSNESKLLNFLIECEKYLSFGLFEYFKHENNDEFAKLFE